MRHANVLVRQSPMMVIPMCVPFYEVAILRSIWGTASVEEGAHVDISFDIDADTAWENAARRYRLNEDAGNISWCEYVYGHKGGEKFVAAFEACRDGTKLTNDAKAGMKAVLPPTHKASASTDDDMEFEVATAGKSR